MQSITAIIQNSVAAAVKSLYDLDIQPQDVIYTPTRKEFEGDYTVTVFAFAKAAKKAPVQIGQEIGQYLQDNHTEFARFNVIQGFLNLVIADVFWVDFLENQASLSNYGQIDPKNQRVMIEFSSPNTNKPLHLGHVRNILLGWACSRILEAAGYEVVRTKVCNDRGIAICKSMVAWQLFGAGKTPATEGVKGDHFVGDFYVLFERTTAEEYKAWQTTAAAEAAYDSRKKAEWTKEEFFKEFKNEYFNQFSALGAQAREMLQKWEASEPATIALWQQMNGWVYEGFNATYAQLGVHFDKIYYESNTYTLGKDIIEEGLSKGVFYQKPDSSVWIDLTDRKLDHKLVLRSDGTSVYITQDIGMARMRDAEWQCQKVAYVVADEQNYHFQVLFEILKKLEEPYAAGLYHLSYGLVELPTGRMKTREGTVVDADDLIAEVQAEAKSRLAEHGEIFNFPEAEQTDITKKVGLAALKFHMLKVNPRKKMVFDPSESVDFQGHTGPYIQYSFARINSILKKVASEPIDLTEAAAYSDLKAEEKELLLKLYAYPKMIEEAAAQYDPSVVADFGYEMAKSFHKFYREVSIIRAETTAAKAFRLKLVQAVAATLNKTMSLLGIEMPERM